MKSELAEELLVRLMQWDRAAFQENVRALEALAIYKFDEYGNYRPGVKFFESLAAWLDQFQGPDERATALSLVLNDLIFISDAEMSHLIELVYPDHIDPILRQRTAEELGCSVWDVARVVTSDAFVALRRRSLILGASDGSRLDRLRRSAPSLSHEQFLQSSDPHVGLVTPMAAALKDALQQLGQSAPNTFAQIFFVDDFAGSGQTMLRLEEQDGAAVYKGKLAKLAIAIARLQEAGLVADDVAVTIVLYIATAQARTHLLDLLGTGPIPAWDVRTVQELPDEIRVSADSPIGQLCERYYDPASTDEHKGRAVLGYAECALPVVLTHNTPNNSVSLLWADTTEAQGGLGRRALFPRYERHHKERP